eukprot:TRINITY_DN27296_c0_g1_i1.p1 TRINITY_DN27296_c0_g1~~TRINITY_DN27296_c0_g1_i1.p1  ORF type:complete len:787 (-),score=139.08 TRINITY_DN27296_c0_g1_i1:183-2543(-)
MDVPDDAAVLPALSQLPYPPQYSLAKPPLPSGGRISAGTKARARSAAAAAPSLPQLQGAAAQDAACHHRQHQFLRRVSEPCLTGVAPFHALGVTALESPLKAQPANFAAMYSDLEPLGSQAGGDGSPAAATPCRISSTLQTPAKPYRTHSVRGSPAETPSTVCRRASSVPALPAVHADLNPRGGAEAFDLTTSGYASSIKRRSAASRAHAKFPREAAARFRLGLLARQRSLHDAFARQMESASWEKGLGPQEFRHALLRLVDDEGDVDELIASLGEGWSGTMALSALFRALVSCSRTSSLWELRCRLMTAGLWPLEGQRLARALWLAAAGREDGSLNAFGCQREQGPTEVGYSQWLELSEAVGMMPFEGRRLFRLLGRRIGVVDLQVVAETLRAIVAPNASLISLAGKTIERHGSLREAFATLCTNWGRLLRRREFEKLCMQFNIKDSVIGKLWVVFASGPEHLHPNASEGKLQGESMAPTSTAEPASPECAGSGENDDSSEVQFEEDEFVRAMLRWVPESVIGSLRDRLCAKFGSLPEGRRTLLRQQGIPASGSLSPRRFRAGLRAVGVLPCDTDAVLHLVRRAGNDGFGGRVTLDDVIDTMQHGAFEKDDTALEMARGDTASAWRRLHAVRKDLQQTAADSAGFAGYIASSGSTRAAGCISGPNGPQPTRRISSRVSSQSPAPSKEASRGGAATNSGIALRLPVGGLRDAAAGLPPGRSRGGSRASSRHSASAAGSAPTSPPSVGKERRGRSRPPLDLRGTFNAEARASHAHLPPPAAALAVAG